MRRHDGGGDYISGAAQRKKGRERKLASRCQPCYIGSCYLSGALRCLKQSCLVFAFSGNLLYIPGQLSTTAHTNPSPPMAPSLLLPSGRQQTSQSEALKIRRRRDKHDRNDAAKDGPGLMPNRSGSGSDEQQSCGSDGCGVNDSTRSNCRAVAQLVPQPHSQLSSVECRLSTGGMPQLLPFGSPCEVTGSPQVTAGSSLNCNQCGIKCSSLRSRRQHEGHAHGSPTCDGCGRQFASLSLLMSHRICQQEVIASKCRPQLPGPFSRTTTVHDQRPVTTCRSVAAKQRFKKKLATLGYRGQLDAVASATAQRYVVLHE